MPRKCFVIMPFSTSRTCTEEEWTEIFRHVIKPAVEGCGLDYECRRSQATRGNILAGIMQDLNDAYVVLADLTDQNPNVFYELGVRHALTSRTILISQNESEIPFDLRAYAYHVYNWKTQAGKEAFAIRIAELLGAIDREPDRSDSPVSDFLGRTGGQPKLPEPVRLAPVERPFAQPLVGLGAEGLNISDLVTRSAQNSTSANPANTIYRLTKREVEPILREKVAALNKPISSQQIQQNQILPMAEQYLSEFEPLVGNIEMFGLSSVEQVWLPGVDVCIRLAGDYISISEQQSQHSLRFAQGAPALLAWRLLVLLGAKAVAETNFDVLRTVLWEPIEVEDAVGRYTHMNLVSREDLFFTEALLGYGDYQIVYLQNCWNRSPYLSEYFGSERDYDTNLAVFLIIYELAVTQDINKTSIYPGYRLLKQANRAVAQLMNRLRSQARFLTGIAHALNETPDTLIGTWERRSQVINNSSLGHRYFGSGQTLLPNSIRA